MGRFIFVAALSLTAFAADVVQEGRRWWSRIEVLAADDMEGRNTGSPGHKKAAHYIAGEFERSGLTPGGTAGYLQPVAFKVARLDEGRSRLASVRNGRVTPLKLGDDAVIGVRNGLATQVDAPAVFVGHGLVIPEAKVDDFAGLDLAYAPPFATVMDPLLIAAQQLIQKL